MNAEWRCSGSEMPMIGGVFPGMRKREDEGEGEKLWPVFWVD